MNNKTVRLDYLDGVKGFAIILVVLGHIYPNDIPIKYWIHSFHVPVFFIVSGILLNHTNVKEKKFSYLLIGRFKSLIIPYISFELIYIFFYMLRNEFTFATFKWNILDSLTLNSRASAAWFLPCLFLGELLFILLLKKLKIKYLIPILMIISLLPFVISPSTHFIKIILRVFLSIFFLSIGYFSSSFIINSTPSLKLIIPTFLLTSIIATFNGLVGMYGLVFNNILIYIICSVFISLSLVFIFKSLPNSFLNFYGANSIIILGTHGLLLELFNFYSGNYLYSSLMLIVILIIEFILIKIIVNYFPWIVGRKIKKLCDK